MISKIEMDSTDSDFETDENLETSAKSRSLKRVKYEDINCEGNNAKKSKKDIQKPPTVEELNNLKETQNLYNNNLFRLQIEELLKEIKIKNKHRNALDKFLNDMQITFNDLPEIVDVKLSETSRQKKKKNDFVTTLLTEDKFQTDQDLILNFSKPQDVARIGLDKIDALAGPLLITNVAVTIPKTFLHPKDYSNNRYFYKRHLYLKYIEYFIQKANICDELTWITHDNNPLLPILQVNCGKITIKLYPIIPDNYLKNSRFLPETNNLKANVFQREIAEEVLSKNCPTPYYNCTLAHDAFIILNVNYVNETLKELVNVREGLKLLQVWQKQHELPIDQYFLAFLTVYLLQKNRINKHMSSYQIVRNFWNFIRQVDLTSTILTLNDQVAEEVLNNFKQSFDLVFIDKSGFYNILAFMDQQTYKKIKSECEIAYKLLDDDVLNSFQSLFISKSPTNLQYDLVLSIDNDESKFRDIIAKTSDEDQVKYYGFETLLVTREILKTLERGLNKRAHFIVANLDDSSSKIIVGINLDQSHAFNFIEMGPPLNDSKEKEFREFWGRLSSDRRFKDGSICVAVYFETRTIKGKREIVKTIIDYVMKDKLNLKCALHYDELEELIVNKKVKASFEMGSNEECCLYVVKASDELGKKIRNLEMPLAIAGLHNISPTYNFTEVFPQIPTNYRCEKALTVVRGDNIALNETKKITAVPKYVKPVECVIQLEQSSKWPKDLEGIREMKTAFYLEIARQLKQKDRIISSARPEFIDVFYSGLVFRYRLHVPKEIGLLKKETTSNGVVAYRETPESRKMEIDLRILPKMSGALKGIQSLYPSYGPSTALIKRWMRAQLIDDHLFPDVALHLLNASLFLNKSQFMASTVPQIGFLRFLKSFSELQSDLNAVVVNFNEEITRDTLANIDAKLLQNRSAYPSLYIATPYDNYESVFTKSAPSKDVLSRVKHLALETLLYVQEKVSQRGLIDEKNQLFVANLEGYDAKIHLRPGLNPLRHEDINTNNCTNGGSIIFEEYDPSVSTKVPVTDFNPIQIYLRELRENYSEFATFFHNSYGGNFIALLWTPRALEIEDFKISRVGGRKIDGDGKLILNVGALIEDFLVMGRDLVKNIELLNSKMK